MAKSIDWLADEFQDVQNPLGSGIAAVLRGTGMAGSSLRRGAAGGGASLLRGMGRGMGALRDRMSQRGGGFEQGNSDSSSASPTRIPSNEGGSDNSEEILIRIISIESILRGMSQLASKSDERDAAAVEDDRQAEEALHRLAENQKETDTTPIFVGDGTSKKEEKKSGGLLSSLFSGLSKFAGLFGVKGKLLLGIAALAAAGTAAYKLWEWLSGDNPDGLLNTLATTLREGFVGVAGGILDTIKEKIGTALSSLNWQEALRLSAAIIPAAAAVVSPLARATAATMDFGGKVGGKVAGAGSKIAKFMGFGKTATPGVMKGAAPGVNMLQALSNPAAASATAKEAAKGTSVLSRISGAIGGLAKRAPGITRGLGLGAKVIGRVARPLAVAWDVHKYRSMEDESAKKWQRWAIGLGVAGLAAGAIALTGGIATPFVAGAAASALGLGSAGASIYAGRKEAAAGAETGGDSPTRPATETDTDDKVGYLHRELEAAGYNYNQSAGIIKNLKEESGPGLNENAVGDAGTAHGIAQWRGIRATNMENYVADAENQGMSRFQGQVGFLIDEMKGMSGGSPTDMPKDYAGAANWVLSQYERPAEEHRIARTVEEGTPAPGDTHASASLYNSAGMVGALNNAVNRLPSIPSPSRQLEPEPDAADNASAAPTAVVAPQTTNNFFDNRNTTIMPPPLDARNRDAVLMAMQNLQGLTHATG